ncbi:MAG: hypothetical protein ACC656_15425, partial [Candidatus Heimdallarchaeota archaeon]
VHKKKILFAFMINLLLLSTIFGNNVLLTMSQPPAPAPAPADEDTGPYRDGRIYGTKLQIKQPGEEFFQEIDSKSNIVPEIKNSSTARFITTLSNTGDQSLFLKGVDILILNSTEKRQTDIRHKFTFYYNLEIGKNSSLNIQFDRVLMFPLFDEVFTIYYSVVFTASGNTSIDLYLSPSFNFTLLSAVPELQPPVFVVWTWILISLLVIGYVVFGIWGNRKLKQSKKEN